ncbi:MAG: dihydrolipoamide acetyltransferase family protein [Hyphomicrobiaceae bacterium]
MARQAIRLPDVGEGITEAEIVEWHVKVGDLVRQDDVVAAIMTDKATVEIPSAISGTVVKLGGEVGDKLAVGADLLVLDSADGAGSTPEPPPAREVSEKPKALHDASAPAPEHARAGLAPAGKPEPPAGPAPASTAHGDQGASPPARPTAAPSVRRRAREADVDLKDVRGTGPAGRITHQDLDAHLAGGSAPVKAGTSRRNTTVTDIRIVGLRRRIAERLTQANARIPHITIVEEVDVTSLESLREELGATGGNGKDRLTMLPFFIRAIVAAVREQPEMNAHFDDEAGILRQYGGVHVGVATHTPGGLMVPVVRHAEANTLWDNAREIARLASAARDTSLERSELTGSTITITSLGPLGAIATTPIINQPEVAVVGINKMSIRPWWDEKQFVPRKMMNISCSFDHRVIDGYPAALFVQKLKTLLEKPAMLFVEGWPDA